MLVELKGNSGGNGSQPNNNLLTVSRNQLNSNNSRHEIGFLKQLTNKKKN